MEKKPRPRSVSAEWQKEVSERQQLLDVQMRILAEKLEVHNAWIRAAFEVGGEEGEEEALDLLVSAVNELNEQWLFHEDHLIVAGTWIEPKVVVGEEEIRIPDIRTDVFSSAQSQGFGVYKDKQIGFPQVGMKFTFPSEVLEQLKFTGIIHPSAFAQPREISLTYLRPPTNEVLGADKEEIMTKMRSYDAILRAYMLNPVSEFYRRGANAQKRFLRSMLQDLDSTLPGASDLDRAYVKDAVVDRMYVTDPADKQKLIRLSASGDVKIKMTGRLVGFEIPELIVNEFPMRSRTDMVDEAGGICMAIEMTDVNIDTGGMPEGSVLIPVNMTRSLDIELT